ncbi:hypothetical protein EPN29_01990 [bacterium]|nr:MAG: hypothetical protein EPN29_01990 [bacterium]
MPIDLVSVVGEHHLVVLHGDLDLLCYPGGRQRVACRAEANRLHAVDLAQLAATERRSQRRQPPHQCSLLHQPLIRRHLRLAVNTAVDLQAPESCLAIAGRDVATEVVLGHDQVALGISAQVLDDTLRFGSAASQKSGRNP